MSMDPSMIQQMLSQRLQPGTAGGMQGQTSPTNAAAQLVQKALLVRALQQPQMQQQQANSMLPKTNAMIQGQLPPPPQAMPPIDPATGVAAPFAQPIPGSS